MENLKNNIQDIAKDGENLVNNYAKLFGIRQSKKLATFLGVISSVFIISTLLLIVIVFGSFVLADFLNTLLESKYMGFLIIVVLYLITVALLLVKMQKTGRPLFTNLFIKFVLPLLNVEISQKPTVEGLNIEKEIIKNKIENDRNLLNVHTILLKYSLFDDFLGVILNYFSSKSNGDATKKPSDSD